MHPEVPKDWPLRDYWEATQTLARTLKSIYATLGLRPPTDVSASIERILATPLDAISVQGYTDLTNQIKSLEEQLHDLRTTVVGYAEDLSERADSLMHAVPSYLRPR